MHAFPLFFCYIPMLISLPDIHPPSLYTSRPSHPPYCTFLDCDPFSFLENYMVFNLISIFLLSSQIYLPHTLLHAYWLKWANVTRHSCPFSPFLLSGIICACICLCSFNLTSSAPSPFWRQLELNFCVVTALKWDGIQLITRTWNRIWHKYAYPNICWCTGHSLPHHITQETYFLITHVTSPMTEPTPRHICILLSYTNVQVHQLCKYPKPNHSYDFFSATPATNKTTKCRASFPNCASVKLKCLPKGCVLPTIPSTKTWITNRSQPAEADGVRSGVEGCPGK
jgi:hypothetical protein